MENNNHYAATAVDLDQTQAAGELASRGTRFGAAMIDAIIGIVIAVPFWWISGFFTMLGTGQKPGYVFVLEAAVWGFAGFLVVHGVFLHRYGQTVGKRLAKIAIVTAEDDTKPAFGKLILLRYLPISLCSIIPVAGNLLPIVDVLFIFRENHRCVHDLIAGTKVIKIA